MRDVLVCIPDVPADATVIGDWAQRVDGGWQFVLPIASAPLPVIAYADLGTPATTDEAGNVLDPGIDPVPAPGWWAIVTLGKGESLPAQLAAHVAAEGDREAGLVLPAGIVGLSTLWAGMHLVPD